MFPVSLGTYNGPKRKQKQCLCNIWADKQTVKRDKQTVDKQTVKRDKQTFQT